MYCLLRHKQLQVSFSHEIPRTSLHESPNENQVFSNEKEKTLFTVFFVARRIQSSFRLQLHHICEDCRNALLVDNTCTTSFTKRRAHLKWTQKRVTRRGLCISQFSPWKLSRFDDPHRLGKCYLHRQGMVYKTNIRDFFTMPTRTQEQFPK